MEATRKVLIVDDHPLFREGLRARILRDRQFQVVEEASSAAEALRKAKLLKPNLVVIDIGLPDQDGIQLTQEIRLLLPDARIMILSMHSSIDYVVDALRSGAIGFVVKGSATEKLMEGLETVAQGKHFLDSSLSFEIAKKLLETPGEATETLTEGFCALTHRQKEVMRLLAGGFSNKKIADVLRISPKTVENHRYQIMERLGLRSSIELGSYAARLGICPHEF